jgi:MFS family permease
MMLSSTFWGHVSDKYGRRRSLLLAGIYLFVYGLLSSFVTSYGWILFMRFLVGISIGCVPQSVTLFAEFLPTKQRAKCVVLLDCFWAFGACLEVLLAAFIMPLGGWRWLLAVSSLPSLIFVIAAATWLPESARFNAASGQSDAALETLERIAEDNGKPMVLGRLIVDDNIHLFERCLDFVLFRHILVQITFTVLTPKSFF